MFANTCGGDRAAGAWSIRSETGGLFLLELLLASLNPKQVVFVAAYIGEAKHNATEAARIAGYKQPHVQGSQLLAKLSVKAAIDEHLTQVKRQGIAHKQNRIDAANDRHQRMQQIIEARAAHDWLADVPGGDTGLVIKQLKHVKHIYERDPDDPDSEERQIVLEQWESTVDTGLLREMREHEKQVAQELGEWTEKSEVLNTGSMRFQIAGLRVPLPATDDGE